MRVKGVQQDGRRIGVRFDCPGCGEHHVVYTEPGHGAQWQWNGSLERPTFTPSLLMMSGHYVSSFKPGDSCWCTYNAEHPDEPSPYQCRRCHSFVRDGQIQFLSDSTHALAGMTVDLPEVSQ